MTTFAEFEAKFALADGYSGAPVATLGTCASCRFRSHAEVPDWPGWYLCYHHHMPLELTMIRKTYACGQWGSREPGSGQIVGADWLNDSV